MKVADFSQNKRKNSFLVRGFKQGWTQSWKMTNYVVVSLEKIGDEVNNIPYTSVAK
jgi:hypothetical protein